jgi:hypothetical protein
MQNLIEPQTVGTAAVLTYDDWLQRKVDASRTALADGTNRPILPEEWAVIRAAKKAQLA